MRCRRGSSSSIYDVRADLASALVVQLRIPITAAPLRCRIQHHPERRRIRRAARILAGIGGRAGHLARPEMADCSVAPGEDAESWDFRPVGQEAEIVARVGVVEIAIEAQILP